MNSTQFTRIFRQALTSRIEPTQKMFLFHHELDCCLRYWHINLFVSLPLSYYFSTQEQKKQLDYTIDQAHAKTITKLPAADDEDNLVMT